MLEPYLKANRSRASAAASSSWFWRLPAERRPEASNRMSARRSSPRGPSGQPCDHAGTLSPAWRSRRGAVASRPGWPAGLTSHAPTGGPGTGLAEVVPGRAVAQLQRPVGHDLAGVLSLEGASACGSRLDPSRIVSGPRGGRAQPYREPSRASPHRGRGRADRAGRARAGELILAILR